MAWKETWRLWGLEFRKPGSERGGLQAGEDGVGHEGPNLAPEEGASWDPGWVVQMKEGGELKAMMVKRSQMQGLSYGGVRTSRTDG